MTSREAGLVLALDGRRPRIDASAWLAPGAVVVGDVTVGAASSIWYHAVLRADTETIVVGAGSNLQDGVVVHADPGWPAVIGDGVTVGHRATIHGARVEDGALIGMGSILLNGSVIGTGTIVGAGALVPEGRVIPPRSLVLGSPGRVVRELSPAEVEGNIEAALHYQKLARYHAESRPAA